MKTKILGIAAATFAFAIAAPSALARPDSPMQWKPSGKTVKSVPRMPDHCAGMSCCATKSVTTAGPSRASSPSFRKVRTCTNDCAVTANDRPAVCRKGRSV